MCCPVSGFPSYIISNKGEIYSQDSELIHGIINKLHYIVLRNKGQKNFYIHYLVYQHRQKLGCKFKNRPH